MKDIDQTRRDNMVALERDAGSPTEAALRAKMSTSQWVNLRNGAADSKTTKPRGMRKGTARKIERSFFKPDGWLDTDHTINQTQSVQQQSADYQQRKQILKLISNAEKLNDSDVELLSAIASLMNKRTLQARSEKLSADSQLLNNDNHTSTSTRTTIIGEDGLVSSETEIQQKYQQ